MEQLKQIQQQLNAPKNMFNGFGGYNYRSCESIFEAVKPLLEKLNCILIVSDTLQEFCGRVYVTAKATLIEPDGTKYEATASAQDEGVKKGMDSAQVTGAASSYARKYALNGLFLIDDVKDPDTEEKYLERVRSSIYAAKSEQELREIYEKQKDSVKKEIEKDIQTRMYQLGIKPKKQ